jgi:thiol-disulfide isomerase/thioredoxin
MKPFLVYLLLIFSTRVMAQSTTEAVVSGNIPELAGKTFSIQNRDHFSKQVSVSKNGSFSVKLNIDTGYYYLYGKFIYLEPGANLVINKKDSVYSFQGKGSVENNLMSQFKLIIKDYLPYNGNMFDSKKMCFMEPYDFFNMVDKYQAAVYKLLDQKISSYFYKTQKDNIDYSIKYCEDLYLHLYGIDQEKRKEAENIIMAAPKPGETRLEISSRYSAAMAAAHIKQLSYSDISALNLRIWGTFDLNNEVLFKFSKEYGFLLDEKITQLWMNALSYSIRNNQYELKRDIVNTTISNSFIKESLIHKYTVMLIKTGKDQDQYYTDYLKMAKDTAYIKDIQTLYTNLKLIAPGSSSPDFTYPGTDGKTLTLSSLKGKYVYIDVWATWCGPCRGEIPSLKQVENKYKNMNITFVGLSIDKKTDTDKWKKFVLDNDLEGKQIIADNEWSSDFTKKYNVTSIPRFILIDPNGNIVSSNADRPSNPALQALLDKLLTKNN